MDALSGRATVRLRPNSLGFLYQKGSVLAELSPFPILASGTFPLVIGTYLWVNAGLDLLSFDFGTAGESSGLRYTRLPRLDIRSTLPLTPRRSAVLFRPPLPRCGPPFPRGSTDSPTSTRASGGC